MTHYDPNRPIIDPEHDPRRDPFRDPAMDAETVSASEARQGPEGRPVLYVLIGGLVLALIAWAAAEMYPRGGSTTATAPANIEQARPGDPQATGSVPSTGKNPGSGFGGARSPDLGGVPAAPNAAPEGAGAAPPVGNTPPAFDSAR
jgi:hypothetical protein